VLELFGLLDSKADGFLDQDEFDQLFKGVTDTWNSHKHDITASILRPGIKLGKNVDIS
jgi:hypothetical protein